MKIVFNSKSKLASIRKNRKFYVKLLMKNVLQKRVKIKKSKIEKYYLMIYYYLYKYKI